MIAAVETVIGFLLAIMILVSVHEWAHFFVARLFGIRVLRFSIGFGKPFFNRHIGPDNMEFCLAPVPLGGYVKMLDSREMQVEPEELDRCFDHRPSWQKICVVAAGPIINILLAVVLFTVLNLVERQTPKVIVGSVATGSPVSALQAGDEVVRINNREVISWADAQIQLNNAAIRGRNLDIEVLRDQIPTHLNVVLDWSRYDVSALGWQQLGIQALQPLFLPIIGDVLTGSAADTVGLQAGDIIQSFNSQPINDWTALVNLVRQYPNQVIQLGVERNGRVILHSIELGSRLVEGEIVGYLGAQVDTSHTNLEPYLHRHSDSLTTAVYKGVQKTWDVSTLIIVSIGRMITGDVSIDNISGPITIAQVAGETIHYGILSFIHFLAFLSISLGILNILPIPMLDGGHIVMYIVESILRGPLSQTAQLNFQKVGIVILVMIMSIALFNDLSRVFS